MSTTHTTQPVGRSEIAIKPWEEKVEVTEIPNDCRCTWSYHIGSKEPWRLKFRYAICFSEIHRKKEQK